MVIAGRKNISDPASVDEWMTCDLMSFFTLFVIPGRWMDDNERLCAIEPVLS